MVRITHAYAFETYTYSISVVLLCSDHCLEVICDLLSTQIREQTSRIEASCWEDPGLGYCRELESGVKPPRRAGLSRPLGTLPNSLIPL